MKQKILVSRNGLAECRGAVAHVFDVAAQNLSDLIIQKKKKGKLSYEDEKIMRAELKEIRQKAFVYREEQRRLQRMSRFFGDLVCISPTQKNQAQKDEPVEVISES